MASSICAMPIEAQASLSSHQGHSTPAMEPRQTMPVTAAAIEPGGQDLAMLAMPALTAGTVGEAIEPAPFEETSQAYQPLTEEGSGTINLDVNGDASFTEFFDPTTFGVDSFFGDTTFADADFAALLNTPSPGNPDEGPVHGEDSQLCLAASGENALDESFETVLASVEQTASDASGIAPQTHHQVGFEVPADYLSLAFTKLADPIVRDATHPEATGSSQSGSSCKRKRHDSFAKEDRQDRSTSCTDTSLATLSSPIPIPSTPARPTSGVTRQSGINVSQQQLFHNFGVPGQFSCSSPTPGGNQLAHRNPRASVSDKSNQDDGKLEAFNLPPIPTPAAAIAALVRHKHASSSPHGQPLAKRACSDGDDHLLFPESHNVDNPPGLSNGGFDPTRPLSDHYRMQNRPSFKWIDRTITDPEPPPSEMRRFTGYDFPLPRVTGILLSPSALAAIRRQKTANGPGQNGDANANANMVTDGMDQPGASGTKGKKKARTSPPSRNTTGKSTGQKSADNKTSVDPFVSPALLQRAQPLGTTNATSAAQPMVRTLRPSQVSVPRGQVIASAPKQLVAPRPNSNQVISSPGPRQPSQRQMSTPRLPTATGAPNRKTTPSRGSSLSSTTLGAQPHVSVLESQTLTQTQSPRVTHVDPQMTLMSNMPATLASPFRYSASTAFDVPSLGANAVAPGTLLPHGAPNGMVSQTDACTAATLQSLGVPIVNFDPSIPPDMSADAIASMLGNHSNFAGQYPNPSHSGANVMNFGQMAGPSTNANFPTALTMAQGYGANMDENPALPTPPGSLGPVRSYNMAKVARNSHAVANSHTNLVAGINPTGPTPGNFDPSLYQSNAFGNAGMIANQDAETALQLGEIDFDWAGLPAEDAPFDPTAWGFD